MTSDIQQFQNDLLESVRQMRKCKAERVTKMELSVNSLAVLERSDLAACSGDRGSIDR